MFSGRSLALGRELCIGCFQVFEFVQDVRSHFIATLVVFHGHDQLQELWDGGNDVLDMLSVLELAAQVFHAHLNESS